MRPYLASPHKTGPSNAILIDFRPVNPLPTAKKHPKHENYKTHSGPHQPTILTPYPGSPLKMIPKSAVGVTKSPLRPLPVAGNKSTFFRQKCIHFRARTKSASWTRKPICSTLYRESRCQMVNKSIEISKFHCLQALLNGRNEPNLKL